MMRLHILAALTALGFATPAAAQATGPLDWLAGEWCTERQDVEPGGVRQTCERWSAMVDGVMRGTSIAWYERFSRPLEDMRITVEPGRLVFHTEPHAQKPADFLAAGVGPGMSVRFENRAHDYPQVVRYWREGDMLMAEISLADGSKPVRWMYRKKY